MARGDTKVMWSGRLPGDLVNQIVEAAEEEGISQAELVEQAMGEWLDDRAGHKESQ
jgi:predicted HicB family RNase H-like nuclease